MHSRLLLSDVVTTAKPSTAATRRVWRANEEHRRPSRDLSLIFIVGVSRSPISSSINLIWATVVCICISSARMRNAHFLWNLNEDCPALLRDNTRRAMELMAKSENYEFSSTANFRKSRWADESKGRDILTNNLHKYLHEIGREGEKERVRWNW